MSRGKNSRRTQKNLAKTTVVAQEKKVEEKIAAETVKETVQPVKKEEVKPVAKKTETVKTEPVKATVKTEKISKIFVVRSGGDAAEPVYINIWNYEGSHTG